MIQRLVAFDTTSRESNLGLIEWVRDWLQGFGIESRLTYDATGKKANLFATIAQGRAARHRALGPHRRRAGRRPAVGHRPVRGDDQRTTASTAAAPAT